MAARILYGGGAPHAIGYCRLDLQLDLQTRGHRGSRGSRVLTPECPIRPCDKTIEGHHFNLLAFLDGSVLARTCSLL